MWPNITGPDYINHDFSIFKNVPFGGNRKFQFRLSAYNVFNHPQRTPDDATNLNLTYANGSQTNTAVRSACPTTTSTAIAFCSWRSSSTSRRPGLSPRRSTGDCPGLLNDFGPGAADYGARPFVFPSAGPAPWEPVQS